MSFDERTIEMPNHDCDLVLRFPSGKTIVIQSRPSNADVNYNGSLDIILPENMAVTNWYGDDMEYAPPISQTSPENIRRAKQIVVELP